ncbi:MAG TPA: threonine/serine dehydratase, partial [Blastocatellia bacterium]|nr:threonine/serine dehydratase [Blastocatellia bacterium]
MEQVTIERIKEAAGRIAGVVRRTPVERSQWLAKELGRETWLKLECFQTTGSFKIRGAMAKLSGLSEEEKARGILTVSAGNHGLAVAHCAEVLSLDATIVVPESASRAKVASIRRYPVTLVERGANYDEAEAMARRMEREMGATFVSPYNDEDVIAGQGTIALEIMEDAPPVDAILAPIGGGGLIAGIAIAAKAINPRVKIYGVEPAASPTMRESLRAGRIVEIEEEETLADGLAGNIESGSMTFPIVRQLVDDIILVSEKSIADVIARVAREDHLIIEGSAAVSIAALGDPMLGRQRVAAVVTGRNISLD